jgi:hypothetical protein
MELLEEYPVGALPTKLIVEDYDLGIISQGRLGSPCKKLSPGYWGHYPQFLILKRGLDQRIPRLQRML